MKNHILICFALLLFTLARGNNIAVTNIKLTGQDPDNHFTMVQFDISWENSWRTPNSPPSYDAAWVFVKYHVTGGDLQHGWLNNTGHTAPAGSTITPGLLTPGSSFYPTTNPCMGVFIYRDAASMMSVFSKTGIQLRWNYGANGVADNDVVDIQVYAIEMVCVPQSAFTVGSGGTESGSFTNGSWTSGSTLALSIGSEAALTIAQSAGNLWGTSSSGNNTIGGPGTLPDAFPKGFAAFYCMKYEISQQGYVDFLNSLTSGQATARYPGQTTNRHGITVSGGVYNTTLPDLACNWLSWSDVAAYLDWCSLRPMTELEFEKACRGSVPPVAFEYAWGAGDIAGSQYTLGSAGTNTELIASNYSTAGNAAYSSTIPSGGAIDGPLRVGVFSGMASYNSRATSGATYYGIMEMSGNVWERVVSVGNTTGRAFTGLHGNGLLDASGNADVTAWPGTTAIGAGFRGGGWNRSDTYLRVSDRGYATRTSNLRDLDSGGRGIRLAE
jgi:formylglycine-generating enzyme required for sulfatase activity